MLAAHLLALKPSKVYAAIPDTMHVPYEKNTITTPDNVKLKSWTFLPTRRTDKKITLVMAYADGGNMSWWLTHATTLSKLGYTVMLFDYRGFGESDPFSIDSTMLYYNEFATDLSAAVAFARVKYAKNKTGIWCLSMGTIVTTLAVKTAQPDFIVGEGYVTDPLKLKEQWARSHKKLDFPPVTADYETELLNIKAPMLIFSGEFDRVTTDESVKKLQKKKPSIIIQNFKGGHLQGLWVLSKEFAGSEYAAAINNFLKVK